MGNLSAVEILIFVVIIAAGSAFFLMLFLILNRAIAKSEAQDEDPRHGKT